MLHVYFRIYHKEIPLRRIMSAQQRTDICANGEEQLNSHCRILLQIHDPVTRAFYAARWSIVFTYIAQETNKVDSVFLYRLTYKIK